MEYVLVVARSRRLCEWCNKNKKGLTLRDALLHFAINVGKAHVHEPTDIDFEPYIYTANYKHSFGKTFDPLDATMRWIFHGFPSGLFWNRFQLTMDSAKIIHMIYEKDVWVIGNAIETPAQLARYPIPKDAFVLRFNKAIIHEKHMDMCIFNDVLYDSLKDKIMRTNVPCIVVEKLKTDFDHMRKNGALFTTGILTVMWLTKFFAMYKSMTVIGFNMVLPGERAHYFDTETPAKPSAGFAGHDAQHEHAILQEYANCKYLRCTVIV